MFRKWQIFALPQKKCVFLSRVGQTTPLFSKRLVSMAKFDVEHESVNRCYVWWRLIPLKVQKFKMAAKMMYFARKWLISIHYWLVTCLFVGSLGHGTQFKGELHPWALFLKTLCIFSKNKSNFGQSIPWTWSEMFQGTQKSQFYFSRGHCCEVTVKYVRKSIFSMLWTINQ